MIDELWIRQLVEGKVQRDYWTVVSDDNTRSGPLGQRVIGLCKTREAEAIQPMLREIMAWYPHPMGPSYVSTDMWPSFKEAVQDVSPRTEVLFDRFHFGRHIQRAVADVWDDCTAELSPAREEALESCAGRPCTCGLRGVCERWQHALKVEEHLDKIWRLSSIRQAERFLADWDRLSRSRWPEDFSKVAWLLNKWRKAVLSAAFLRHKGEATRGTAVAERVNRELRRVIRQHRLTPLESSLDRLFDILQTHRPPTTKITAFPLKGGLLCPTCGATGPEVRPAPDARAVQVHHLPHGLDRVKVVLPSRVACPHCSGHQSQPSVSQALATWFEQPAQWALSQAELVRLTGLPGREVGQRMQACLALVRPATEPAGDVLVYSEVWTSRRVWLVLSCPVAGAIEIAHVPLTAGRDDPHIHARVATRVRSLVEPYRQKRPRLRLHLTTQTGELARELKPWIQASRVTLKPFVLRSLVVKFRKQALRVAKDSQGDRATSIKPRKGDSLDDIFLLPSGQLSPDPDFYLTDLAWELDEMEHGLATGNRHQVIRLLRQRPRRPRGDGHPPSAWIQDRMWSAWVLWEDAIVATLAQPAVNTGYEPHLVARIREHLHTSPALHPERQRQRLLLLLAEERQTRQETRRRRC